MIETARLILRRWKDADREPFAALNADPRVMEFLTRSLTRVQSDATIARIEADFERDGFGLWAVEIPGVTSLAGFVGLAIPQIKVHFTPAVEIGWRLAAQYWGQGYATEAAKAALKFGWKNAGLKEIVSFAASANVRSQRVMQKIGMTRNRAEDFDHPSLPDGHPLKRHVLYRIARPR